MPTTQYLLLFAVNLAFILTNLYRCDRYVFPEYRIGNILQGSLHDMMQTNRKFGEYKLDSLPSACLHCDVAHLCFGGITNVSPIVDMIQDTLFLPIHKSMFKRV